MLPPFPVCTGRDFLHKPEEEDYPLFSRDRSRKRAFLSRSEALDDDARESNPPSKNVEYKAGLLEIVFLEYFRAEIFRELARRSRRLVRSAIGLATAKRSRTTRHVDFSDKTTNRAHRATHRALLMKTYNFSVTLDEMIYDSRNFSRRS